MSNRCARKIYEILSMINRYSYPMDSSRVNKIALSYVFTIPLLGYSGALLIQKGGINAIALLMIAVVSLSAIVLKTNSTKRNIAILYSTSLALLWLNANMSKYPKTGDIRREYYFSSIVLNNNKWFHTLPAPKNSLIQLNLSYPMISDIMNIDLLLIYQIVYPMILSLFTVFTYMMYCNILSREEYSSSTIHSIAYFSVLLIIISHPYFTLLSKNTRTGFAITAFSFSLWVLSTKPIDKRNFIMIISGFLIMVFSHYAMSMLFLLFILFIYINKFSLRKVGIDTSTFDILESVPAIATLYLVYIIWFMYTSSSIGFELVVQALRTSLLGLFSNSSVGTRAINVPVTSLTYEVIKYNYILILGISGIMLVYYLLKFDSEIRMNDLNEEFNTYIKNILNKFDKPIVYLGIYGCIVGLGSFTIGSIGIGRLLILILLFLAPLFISFWRKIPKNVGIRILPMLMTVMLLINSGFLATTIFHERSPQPQLDKDRILEEGSEWEEFHLYTKYYPMSDYYGSKWVNKFKSKVPIYGSGGKFTVDGFLFTTRPEPRSNDIPGVCYRVIKNNTTASDGGYTYLPQYVTRNNRLVPNQRPSRNYLLINWEGLSVFNIDHGHKIYSSDENILIKNRGENRNRDYNGLGC